MTVTLTTCVRWDCERHTAEPREARCLWRARWEGEACLVRVTETATTRVRWDRNVQSRLNSEITFKTQQWRDRGYACRRLGTLVFAGVTASPWMCTPPHARAARGAGEKRKWHDCNLMDRILVEI